MPNLWNLVWKLIKVWYKTEIKKKRELDCVQDKADQKLDVIRYLGWYYCDVKIWESFFDILNVPTTWRY